jgi:hypothetical protein
MREVFYFITLLVLSLQLHAQKIDSLSIRIFKNPSKNWAHLDNTFTYKRNSAEAELSFKQQTHTILLGDTIIFDSCIYIKSTNNSKDSSQEIELLSTCNNYIPASLQIFDKVFGAAPRLSNILIPDLDYGNNKYQISKASKNNIIYLNSKADTMMVEQMKLKKQRQFISTYEYELDGPKEPTTYKIFFDRNNKIKKITLDHFSYNKTKKWDVTYKNSLISIKTNYYQGRKLKFYIDMPKQISFSELLLNKHDLFFWETIPFNQNLEFWIMPFLEPHPTN